MEFLFVPLAGITSVLVMFLIAKVVGYRQISNLSMYDYINSITLGSIAADLAISSEWRQAVYCLIAMVIYGLFTFLFSLASSKSLLGRRLVVGHPIVLMQHGKIYENSFKQSKLDLDEFMTLCRVSGYFDISKIDTAIMEPNGKISFIPITEIRPATAGDMQITSEPDAMVANVIIDGKLLANNLEMIGHDESWLQNELGAQGFHEIKDIFLAICDKNSKLSVYVRQDADKHNVI